jgi:hypothetical protein
MYESTNNACYSTIEFERDRKREKEYCRVLFSGCRELGRTLSTEYQAVECRVEYSKVQYSSGAI